VRNPLGSEDAAFRFLTGAVVVVAVIMGLVFLVRAIS
jgi:hypothetical protein